MSFDLLWIMSLVDGSIPTGHELNAGHNICFAPVSHDLAVFTLDVGVWNNLPTNRKIGATSKFVDLRGYDIASIRKLIETHSGITLLGCVDRSDSRLAINGKPIVPDLSVNLSTNTRLFAPFVELGYDVVDAGALSGLANVGLSKSQSESLARFKKLTNARGLFGERSDAMAYGKAISALAPEHAPFCPVRVLCNTL